MHHLKPFGDCTAVMSNLARILSRDHTVWIRALWRSLAGLNARKLCKNQSLSPAFSSAMKMRAEIGCVMQKHFLLSLLSLPVYKTCCSSVGKQRQAERCLSASTLNPSFNCFTTWAGYKFKLKEMSNHKPHLHHKHLFLPHSNAHLHSVNEMRQSYLYQKESQVNRDHDCSSATLIYTALNSGHLWTQAERQVHELWTNTMCQNTSIIISHGQAKHNVDICTKLIQRISQTPWLTAKGDVRFMLLNKRLLTEWEMLKDFKIKLMESQSSSQKSDKWFLTTRENWLIHQLILFFKACTVVPRKCNEKAVNINIGNKCFKCLQQGCKNYTSSQKLQAVISKSSRTSNI